MCFQEDELLITKANLVFVQELMFSVNVVFSAFDVATVHTHYY